jgi:RNA polymerase sigma-70 factor (ECF subfamily)
MKVSREEFEQLAVEQLDTLYRLALRLTGKQADAEDLVQEAYYRAIRSWESFDLQQAGIRPWLVRILRNTFLTKAQRESRQPNAIDSEILEATAGSALPPDARPWSPELAEGMDEELVHAMESLPEEYRTTMVLWALEDFSYQEIAQALEIPIGTVMSRLHRARAKLAEKLAAYARREGIQRE